MLKKPRIEWDPYPTPYLGHSYSKAIVEAAVAGHNYSYTNDDDLVKLLEDQKIVSVYGGRSESGRRALGNRSILADPRQASMKDLINEKVKHREPFRPFAPSVLREDVAEWFVHDVDCPYMSFSLEVKKEKRKFVPAILHKDGTARLQTVSESDNRWYYDFLCKWKERTGVPMVLNTSFNDREPIVETPEHAVNCFLKTDIDYLYFRDCNILVKK